MLTEVGFLGRAWGLGYSVGDDFGGWRDDLGGWWVILIWLENSSQKLEVKGFTAKNLTIPKFS